MMRDTTAPGCVLAFDDERDMAAALAGALDVPLALIERHRFPDGERFADAAKTEKWFRRNCNDVVGRECVKRRPVC